MPKKWKAPNTQCAKTIFNYSKDVFPNINCTQAAEIDLNLQTRPSKGPNMSSVWIWRKSVQLFPRYLTHKKSHRHQLLTQVTVVWGILSLLRVCHFVCTVTDFSVAEKDRGVKFLHAWSTTIRDELLPFWWNLARGESRRRHYFRDVCGHLPCTWSLHLSNLKND